MGVVWIICRTRYPVACGDSVVAPRAENMTSDSANGLQRGFFAIKTYVVISHIQELIKGFFIE